MDKTGTRDTRNQGSINKKHWVGWGVQCVFHFPPGRVGISGHMCIAGIGVGLGFLTAPLHGRTGQGRASLAALSALSSLLPLLLVGALNFDERHFHISVSLVD